MNTGHERLLQNGFAETHTQKHLEKKLKSLFQGVFC